MKKNQTDMNMNDRSVQHFDRQTFAKLGVTSPSDQNILSNLMNGCVAIASDVSANAFMNLARSLKRKAHESDQPPHQQARVTSTPSAHELEAKIKEIADLKEELNLQQSRGNATALQLSTAQREIRDLRELTQSKIKECNTLMNDMGKLEKCNDTLTRDIGVLEKCVDERSAKIKTMVQKLQSTSSAGSLNQQVITSLKDFVTFFNTAVPELYQIITNYDDEVQIETHRLKRRIAMLNDQILKNSKHQSFIDAMSEEIAVCPIPTRDGRVISLKSILEQWKSFPGDYEGDFCSTFKSTPTGSPTSIASVEQVQLIREIANDIGISLTMPIQIQYTGYNNMWCDFMLREQIAVFSRICKMIRCKSTLKKENIIVNGGSRTLSLRLATADDSESSFTMHLELLSKMDSESDERVYARVLINDATLFPEVIFKSEHPPLAEAS